MNGILSHNKHDVQEIILIELNVVKKTNNLVDLLVSLENSKNKTKINLMIFIEGHGEARDELSLLTREAAVRILAYLDVDDLARCAQVCRNWKMLTQSSMLWSKLDLHQASDVLDDRLAMRFIQRARPYLQHLNLRQCSRIGRLTFLGKIYFLFFLIFMIYFNRNQWL